MRRPRLKAPKHHEKAYYHCISRVVNREFVLKTEEKEKFVEYMRLYEGLYGLRVVTYCVMSNHFHVLVEVPKRPEDHDLPTDAQLVAHVRQYLGEVKGNELEADLKHLKENGVNQAYEKLREKWFSKMWDVSAFMKVLKQRFSQWFNGKHKRRGTLWEDRFRSVLVEDGRALKTMAAYIDLNPVRAGICDDPKEYRWCGYAEAVAGGKEAREAVVSLTMIGKDPSQKMVKGTPRFIPKTQKDSMEMWRRFLFGLPETPERAESLETSVAVHDEKPMAHKPHPVTERRKISREKALEVLAEGGKLSEAEYLRCRVRYFVDGAAIGARAYVEDVFSENRELFGERRKDGARKVRGLKCIDGCRKVYQISRA